jgi:hypothetical protein
MPLVGEIWSKVGPRSRCRDPHLLLGRVCRLLLQRGRLRRRRLRLRPHSRRRRRRCLPSRSRRRRRLHLHPHSRRLCRLHPLAARRLPPRSLLLLLLLRLHPRHRRNERPLLKRTSSEPVLGPRSGRSSRLSRRLTQQRRRRPASQHRPRRPPVRGGSPRRRLRRLLSRPHQRLAPATQRAAGAPRPALRRRPRALRRLPRRLRAEKEQEESGQADRQRLRCPPWWHLELGVCTPAQPRAGRCGARPAARERRARCALSSLEAERPRVAPNP